MTDADPIGVHQRQLDSMLAVTRAVAAAEAIDLTLGRIAEEAAGVVDGRAARVDLLRADDSLTLGGAWPPGLDDSWSSPAKRAIERRRTVVVAGRDDSLVATPLLVDADTVGVLSVQRSGARRWTRQETDLLTFFAQHAAHAIRTAGLIDRQDRQLMAATRVVRGLREQIHEHANRIHSIDGMLALDEAGEVRRFVAELLARDHQAYGAITASIGAPTLAGLVLAETMIAKQQDIALRIDRRSRLTELRSGGVVEATIIVGHLLRNAMDAVADAPRRRRRVTFAASGRADGVTLLTRDWGDGAPRLGQSMLVAAVSAARGVLRVEVHGDVRTTTVELPGTSGRAAVVHGEDHIVGGAPGPT